MSRYRLLPSPAQEVMLRDHCTQARFVWNLAVEQHQHWRPGRKSAPGYHEQCRQLTEARAENAWLAEGSQTVQQQALRDYANAMTAFFDPGNPAGRPTWRKAGRDEGFRIVGRRGTQWDVRRVSRKVGQVWVPKVGWVSLVPECAAGREVLPSDPGPRRALAYRLRSHPRSGPGTAQWTGRGHRQGRRCVCGPVHWGIAARGRSDHAGAQEVAALATQASPRPARLEPAGASEACDRPVARPGNRPAEGLGRESQYRPGAPVRRDQGGRPEDQEHDTVCQRNAREPRPERRRQGRIEQEHPSNQVGTAGAPPGGEGGRPGGEDQTALHKSALLGVRAGTQELAREPSRLPVYCLRIRLQC